MVFVNNYPPEPEVSEEELYGPEPYDLNFILPVPPVLSTDKLRLVPFIPRVHAAAYFDAVRGHETMYQYMPVPLENPSDFLRTLEMFRRDKTAVMFAVIDTTRPDTEHPEWEGSLAGIFGLLQTDKINLVTEIGPAIILPAFQRTHVASHAAGLLLKHVLDIAPSGLGFRKVKWVASPSNLPSNKLAQWMGFKLEGLIRWAFVIPRVEGYQKDGKEARARDAGDGLLGRDSNELTLCWDDWEQGGRELVEQAFARVA
ncbi:acyl-CoA N-acyltransferase [Melanogaster broomeanus]|nr:acyl-CoA N-acyltransferase [Melanogaster broomeanus]